MQTSENYTRRIQKLKDLKSKYDYSQKDEIKAVDEYTVLSEMARGLDFAHDARTIQGIKNDEARHASYFNNMIKSIDSMISKLEKEKKQAEVEEVRQARSRYARHSRY